MTEFTYTVTHHTFPAVGVVEGKVVATGLTRRKVVERFGEGVRFRLRELKTEPAHVPEYAADPEWR